MSSKQDTVADSTTEAEYIAACEAAKEGVWIRNFLDDLGIFPGSVKPLDLYCDNSGAIAQAKEPRNHHKVRHRAYLQQSPTCTRVNQIDIECP